MTRQKTITALARLLFKATNKKPHDPANHWNIRISRVLASVIFGAFGGLLLSFCDSGSQVQAMAIGAARKHFYVNTDDRGITPVAVFGKDERERLPAHYQMLKSQIGLLHNPRTNTLCTAFCVAEDIIATASHCLFSHHKNARLYLSDFVFKLPSAVKDTPRYVRLAGAQQNQSRQFIITGTSNLSRKPPIGAARDWAIARLDRPACRGGWLQVPVTSPEALAKASLTNRLFQVAFHTDFGNWEITYTRACTVNRSYGNLTWHNIKRHFSEPQSLILHSCDTGEASSGSPILMDGDKGPVAVGINVGTYQQRDIIVRNGRIISHSKFRTIANTAVSTSAFASSIDSLRQADLLTEAEELKSLQARLKDRGFYFGKVDGVYGAATETALKAYERATNHTVTGLATRSVLAELGRTGLSPVSIDTSDASKAPRLPTSEKPSLAP